MEGRRMNIGKTIQERRLEKGMTQEQLAEMMYVSPQAVSQWENGKSIPDIDKLKDIAGILGISFKQMLGFSEDGTQDWELRDRMFSEEHMNSRLRAFAQAEGLSETYRALSYIKKMHAGQYRKSPLQSPDAKIPYVIHPLMMACQAHALGLRDDNVLAVTLLHDVCEDCGVDPEELPFNETIRDAVGRLTKQPGYNNDTYYEGIMESGIASIVKAIDRCNNVSAMAAAFTDEKLIKYVNETEQYVYPLLEHIKNNYLEYADAAFILKYHILSVIETIKCMMLR